MQMVGLSESYMLLYERKDVQQLLDAPLSGIGPMEITGNGV
jgi:hypothetical protein